MARQNRRQQKNGGNLGEFRRLHVHGANADPALGPQGRGADQAYGNQAQNREAVHRNQQRAQPLERQAFQGERDHGANAGRDPVVVPVGVVSLALGAGDQHTSDGHHGQRYAPEDPFPGPLASSAAGRHRQTGAATCWTTRSANRSNSWALAESGREITIGWPQSPPS